MQKTLYTVFYFITGLFAPARPTEAAVAKLTVGKLQTLANYDGSLPYHESAVRSLVWELKYRANGRAQALAGEYLADLLLAEAEESIGTLLIIPMPMHKERRKERGFNQTELLCEAALKVITADASGKSGRKNSLGAAEDFFYGTFAGGFIYNPGLLIRTINTKTQQGLERHERLQNVKNSMQVTHPEQVRARVCIVVDDVSTTGATFAEAKRALKAAGASEVRLIALAQS